MNTSVNQHPTNKDILLNSKWSVHSYTFSGNSETDYTSAEMCYGTNEYGDGPKGTVCYIKIPKHIPISERKRIIEIISNANNGQH